MKTAVLVLCVAIASCSALPANPLKASVLDLLGDLENVVHDDGRILLEKMINAIHVVESGVEEVRDMVPKAYEKLHQEVDEILAGLKKVTEEIQEVLGKHKAQYGFDLDFLSGLTELSGGTKLSTVLSFLSLADKAHRVMNDAKEFQPNLNKALNRIQDKVEKHMTDFTQQVIQDLGLKSLLQSTVKNSVTDKLEELIKTIKDEGGALILDLSHKIKLALDLFKLSLPDENEKFKKAVKDVEDKLHDLIEEIEKSIGLKENPVKPSTVFNVSKLVAKFRDLVNQVKGSGVQAEGALKDSVKAVEDSALNFYHKIFNNIFS